MEDWLFKVFVIVNLGDDQFGIDIKKREIKANFPRAKKIFYVTGTGSGSITSIAKEYFVFY